jgi:Lrp/AsnC family transcriptional regulator, leucine-responsive regulatory protein
LLFLGSQGCIPATNCLENPKVQQKIADDFDLKILRELQADARITNNELAERIGLSPRPA